MGQYSELGPGMVVADFPMLSEPVRREAEQLHDGKLWAWTVVEAGDVCHLAVCAANLPGLRVVASVTFPSYEDAAFAAAIHNNQRAISPTEASRILASSAAAEDDLSATISDAEAHSDAAASRHSAGGILLDG